MNGDFYILADVCDGTCTHREYYSQFVTPLLKQCVLKRFNIDFLKKKYAEDTTFSGIGLLYWDGIVSEYLARMNDNQLKELRNECKIRGNFYSTGGMISVAKEAAIQLVNGE